MNLTRSEGEVWWQHPDPTGQQPDELELIFHDHNERESDQQRTEPGHPRRRMHLPECDAHPVLPLKSTTTKFSQGKVVHQVGAADDIEQPGQ
jgi:hypothetical protein